jgi:Pvc16 N-terminal domain
MIQEALTYISEKINLTFFTPSNSPRVILGNVTTLSDPGNTEPNVLLSLINIEEEVLLRNPENYIKKDSSAVYKNPPMHFNITIIFGAYKPNQDTLTTNYEDSISKIQRVIGFFQRQNVFDRTNFPDLPGGIEKLIFELVNLNLEQLHHLWSMLGGKYIPSVVYKMRMVVIDEALGTLGAPLISQIVIDDKIKFQQ